MKPEKQQLIHDLLDGESRREATLLAGTAMLRRRRHWRAAWRALGLMALAGLTALVIEQNSRRRVPTQIAMPATKPSASLQIKSLTDEELLGLFPNTPVGLATLPNGRKMLIFPRPGDEAKYVGRL